MQREILLLIASPYGDRSSVSFAAVVLVIGLLTVVSRSKTVLMLLLLPLLRVSPLQQQANVEREDLKLSRKVLLEKP